MLPALLDDDYDRSGAAGGGSRSPMTPDSVPALLAEEWMIDPHSPLPSFLELMMIQDADRSVTKAFRTVLDSLAERLRAFVDRQSNGSSEEEDSPSFSDASRSAAALAQRARRLMKLWAIRLAAGLDKVLQRDGAEIRCLLRYQLERRLLRSHNCTLAESLYGVMRVRGVPSQQDEKDRQQFELIPLRTIDQTRLALVLALGPYLKEKLKGLYTRWKEERRREDSVQSDSEILRRKLRRLFVKFYPIVLASVQASDVYCQWRYLMGFSHFTDLRNLLLGQVVRRKTQQDSAVGAGGGGGGANRIEGAADNPRAKTRLQSTILYVIGTAVTVSWLARLRSWYLERHRERLQQLLQQDDSIGTDEVARLRTLAGIPPPPPVKDAKAIHVGCPLCGRRSRILPTACAPSGVVFCLACIRPFVREHGSCPVTGKAVSESQLVRLFEPTELVNIRQ